MGDKDFKESVKLLCADYSPDKEAWKLAAAEVNVPSVEKQTLVYRLTKRAEIRRQISSRKSVQEGKPDRIADLLDEAAAELNTLYRVIEEIAAKAAPCGYDSGDSGILEICEKDIARRTQK